MITFKYPYFLLLLPIVIFAVYYIFWIKDKGLGIVYPTVSKYIIPFKLKSVFYRKIIMSALYFIFFVLLIVILARPQIPNTYFISPEKGIDIILALDISGSMQAIEKAFKDVHESRLDTVKKVISDFIKKRKSDRIGLVLFAGEAYTQCPLTVDYSVLNFLIKKAKVGLLKDGTAIGVAIATSVKRLKDLKAKSKVIILLTDGSNNSGSIDPIMAAKLAKKFGIKIYTIGVGSNNPVLYPVRTPFGDIKYVETVIEADEDLLKKIASITGGAYFKAESVSSLGKIYEKIDKLEKTKRKIKQYVEYKDIYEPLLKVAVMLVIIIGFLENTLFLRIP